MESKYLKKIVDKVPQKKPNNTKKLKTTNVINKKVDEPPEKNEFDIFKNQEGEQWSVKMANMVNKIRLVTEGRIVLSDIEIRKLYNQSKNAKNSIINSITLKQQKQLKSLYDKLISEDIQKFENSSSSSSFQFSDKSLNDSVKTLEKSS